LNLPAPSIRILSLAEYPAALSLCARWNFEQWGREEGKTLEEIAEALRGMSRTDGSEHAFVALVEGEPAGMVLLIDCDLASHAHLKPWVAGVYVEPAFRRRGAAAAMVAAAEECARSQGSTEAFLYTGIPGLYARLGWSAREILGGKEAGSVLMAKRL